jgi:putative iron-dependent peroxidase
MAARYLRFTLRDASRARAGLRALARAADSRALVVGLSSSLVNTLGAAVPGLRPFPQLRSAKVAVPRTPGSLWCWLRGDDHGTILHQSRAVEAAVSPAFKVAGVVDAFRHREGRDLTGYVDGTENPTGARAVRTALVAGRGPGLDGGSFVAVQQWLHDFSTFDSMKPRAQDLAIGRRRADNEEIDAAPKSAHVKRTAQENFDPEAFVLRRSMPWVEGRRAGLMFVAFGHSFDAFEAQMRRMAGMDDGVTDALFQFTRPLTGNYYWCPPVVKGALDLRAVLGNA